MMPAIADLTRARTRAAGPVKPAGGAAAPGRAAPSARKKRRPSTLPVAMFSVTLLLIVLHQGRLLEVLYPVAAVGVGYSLYRRHPAHYVGFVCWLFFLTPEVRRFADYYNSAFNPTSPIQIAPLAVAMLSGLGVVRGYRMLGRRGAAPLLLIGAGILYAYAMGAINVGLFAATYTAISWVLPIFIAFHLVRTWQIYPLYQRVLTSTFTWGSVVMATYALIQYVFAPPWDAFWLIQAGMSSEGSPVPFGMRVCSTMNSSGPFAIAMMVGLLISVGSTSNARWVASLFGLPALALTFVRSSWGGFTVGIIWPLLSLPVKARLRLVMTAFIVAGLCVPLASLDQVSDRLSTRFATISNLSNDSSFQARSDLYAKFGQIALEEIAGTGLGAMGVGAKLSSDDKNGVVSFDSGLMEVPITLGWPGTLLYMMGLMIMLWRAIKCSFRLRHDRFLASNMGIALSILTMMVFANMLTGSSGLFCYMGVTFPSIAWRYARYARHRNALAARALQAAQAAQPAAAKPSASSTDSHDMTRTTPCAS